MFAWLAGPWPWYVAGPLLGLVVPLLLLLGNQQFGVSSTFRHICAAVLPLRAAYFQYDWRKKSWSLVLMAGVVAGALLAVTLLDGDRTPAVSSETRSMLADWGIGESTGIQPPEIFAPNRALSFANLLMLSVGGFLVGFGTRYANGCTSGHGVMGLSLLNFGSLVAVIGFFVGGIPVSRFVVPWLLSL